MRRLLSTVVLAALFSSALVVLPVAADPESPKPHPVVPTLRTGPATGATSFSTVGATWDASSTGHVELRTRTRGAWSSWTPLEPYDAGPDATGDDARSATQKVVSEPVWVGASDRYETRSTGKVVGLQVVTVDPGTSAADAVDGPSGANVAAASAAQPTVYTRAQWGADESQRSVHGSGCATPDYSSTVKVGFVHHTAGDNGYAANDVPRIIRSIYAYHVQTNGWCDIGYNFLVDAFGRVWEGRYGGITRPVIGAHTGGHNALSFGVALLGKFTDVAPPARMLTGLKDLFAWKLGLTYADPTSSAQLTSGGGGTSKFPAGSTNTFNVVSAHRDAGNTECPGLKMWPMLPDLRPQIRTQMGAGLVLPKASGTSSPYQGSGVTVTSGVLESQQWSLDVRSADGTLVRSYAGLATDTISQAVDLKDSSGAWLPVGSYTLTLSSNAGANVAVPWKTTLDVTGSTPTVTSFTPVTPARLLDTRTTSPLGPTGTVSVKVVGVGGVPSSGVAAVAVNLTGIASDTATFLSAYPGGTSWPGTSSVNLAIGQTHATLVVPKVGTDGTVTVYNGAGSTHAIVDVVGYYSSAGSTFTAVTPSRLIDTRSAGGVFSDGETRTVQVGGQAGVPADATAVVANVTVTQTSAQGYLSAYPDGAARPATSTLNFSRGETAANRITTGLSAGKLDLYLLGSSAHVLVDVVGYYAGVGSQYTPVAPARVLDTRSANGVPGTEKVAGDSTTVVPVAGRGGVPADATAVAVTLTTTGVTRDGYVTAWSGAGARPVVSDVNTWKGHDVANLAVISLASGSLSLYNFGDPAHLVADVVGFYR